SILISVVVFGHSVAWWQWVGVLCVFGGLSMSVQAKYAAKKGAVETQMDNGAGNGGAKSEVSAKNGTANDKKKEL
ncbi:unnamed protein product, partial [Laminaria digitata]